MFKNLKIRAKLLLGFGTITVIMGVLAFVNYSEYNTMRHNAEEVSQKDYTFLKYANTLARATVQVQQWCTDISATRGRDGLNDGLEMAAMYADSFHLYIDSAKQLEPSLTDKLDNVANAFEKYYAVGVEMANTYIARGPAGGNKKMSDFDAAAESIHVKLDAFVDETEMSFHKRLASMAESSAHASSVNIWLTLFAILASLSIAFLVSGKLSQQLFQVVGLTEDLNHELEVFTDAIETVSANDLSKEITISVSNPPTIGSNDEVGTLMKTIGSTLLLKNKMGSSLKKMQVNLNTLICDIVQAMTDMNNAIAELSDSSKNISEGAKTQSDQVAQISAAVEQMSANVVESSKHASEASEASQRAAESATQGGGYVSESINGMGAISTVVGEAANSIEKLSKSADQIGEIITAIDNIADQTNLLALNAAIEAARAGEQGRGFAVVADEVRKLAEQTSQATNEIAEMIKEVQSNTNTAVQTMNSGIEEVTKGQETTDRVGESINSIVDMSQTVMRMIQQMATATNEQATAAEDISSSIQQITLAISDSSAEAEKTATLSENCARLSSEVKEALGKFTLRS